jgi:membrane fusion protein, multidrug efflux system
LTQNDLDLAVAEFSRQNMRVARLVPKLRRLSKWESYKSGYSRKLGARMTQENPNYTENAKPTAVGQGNPAGEKRRAPVWPWLVVAAVVVVGGYLYLKRNSALQAQNSADPSAPRPVMVSTAAAKKGDLGVYIDALGTVTPVYTVTVTSRVQGEITQVYYKEGQMVRKGDPLLEIDPRPYQAQLTQAEGQLAHDQAVLTEAKIDRDRYQQAFNRNAIAKQQLDDQEQVVLQDEGTVKNDEGTLANAKVNLVYTHITSPIDGRVGLRLVDPGNIVQAGSTTPLVVVTQLQPITVIFSVAEDYLGKIQQRLRKGAKLGVDAFDRDQTVKLASGYLLTLDNVIDTTTGTVKLKAQFPNTDNALFPSQFVNARLLVDTLKDVTLIPTPAIQRNAQGSFVYVIDKTQTAAVRTVTVGITDGSSTQVDGIQPGDVVAVNGFDKLQDGSKVSIRGSQKNSSGSSSGSANRGGSNSSGTDQGGKPGSSSQQQQPTGHTGGSAN